VIAALWMLSFFLYGVGGLAAVPLLHLQGTAMAVTLLSAIVLALLSALMAVGLWSRSPWARILQLVLAVQGLCGPFFVASAAILIYMLRDDVKIHFSGRQDFRDLSPQEAETARRTGSEGIFTGAVLGGVFLGVVALGIVAALVVPGIAGKQAMAQAASEAAVVAQVRSVLAGEEAFRMATCGTGYADLDSLIHPAAVIPNYSANSGSAFLAPEMAQSERFGYRFELRAEELVPPVEGCPTKSFRRFRYLAMPISGKGHGYLGVPEGTIHVAEGRAPTPDDPLLN
jgi:hypothetical protein